MISCGREQSRPLFRRSYPAAPTFPFHRYSSPMGQGRLLDVLNALCRWVPGFSTCAVTALDGVSWVQNEIEAVDPCQTARSVK